MSLFRSEEHVDAWLRATRNVKGAVLPLARVMELTRAWYTDPRDPGWRPRTPAESQAVLASVGLTSEFWQLTRASRA